MSNNIDNVKIKANTLHMKASHLFALSEKPELLPEGNFIELLELPILQAFANLDYDRAIVIKDFEWFGECSGDSYRYLVDEIFPLTTGEFNGIFIFEDGELIRVITHDGRVTEEYVI